MALAVTHCPWCPSSTPSTSTALFPISLTSFGVRNSRFFAAGCLRTAGNGSTFDTAELDLEIEELDMGEVNKPKKKKRKPRPSFYQLVQERWSVKVDSLRTKFPWEDSDVEEEKDESSDEIRPENFESSRSQQPAAGVENRGESVVGGFRSRRPAFAAPWDHGARSKIANFKVDATVSDSDEEKTVTDQVDGEDLAGKAVDLESVEVNLTGGGADIRLPWVRGAVSKDTGKRRNTELAESTIPEAELRRLRGISLKMTESLKVGAAGVTQAVVDNIIDKWKSSEVVKIKFEGPPAMNMRRTHLLLEKRSGGVVIWRSGSLVVLYRGMTYKLPCVQQYVKLPKIDEEVDDKSNELFVGREQSVVDKSKGMTYELLSGQQSVNLSKERDDAIDIKSNDLLMEGDESVVRKLKVSSTYSKTKLNSKSSRKAGFENLHGYSIDLKGIDSLLSELGPRFYDWSGYDPIPVDADLLPPVVPGYEPPIRMLPYRVKPSLKNQQMTFIRRSARKMPPHFALGRSRQHQGLAAAMVKLWEKSAVAKIAIKRGVPNTNNERMAEELKRLTGGVLVSRNKDYIVFYRGNDFLLPTIKGALVERELLAAENQENEEKARAKAVSSVSSTEVHSKGPYIAGTLAETTEAKSRWGTNMSSEERDNIMRNQLLSKHAGLIKHMETKLAQAHLKVGRAESELLKIRHSLDPADLPTDIEVISDEERELFRKIGLSMKPFLLLGRRGVFDGTVENIHLHWKYREVVKVLVVGRSLPLVKHAAISLEAESGGILISVDKTTKGYVIILYRGKNYQRPSVMRPKNLLTKRQALANSIELQRREAIKHHISDLRKQISLKRSQLRQMETTGEASDEILQSQSQLVDADANS